MKERFSYLLSIVAWLILSFSCTKQVSNTELLRAEALMDEYPDSALTILKEITGTENLSKKDHANYCLLYTQALDKNLLPLKSDSLINIAVDYYQTSSDSIKKATAYYYVGRVNQLMTNYEDALNYYHLALEAEKKEKQYNLLTLIYNNLGNLYVYQKLYDLALDAQQKSYKYACLQKNVQYYPFLLRDIGRVYLLEKKSDSALYYYNKASNAATDIKNLKAQTSIQNELALIYEELGQYEKAMNCIDNSIKYAANEDRKDHAYLVKGNIYLEMGLYDSARVFLNKSVLGNNTYLKVAAYRCLYTLEKKLGNYEKAININDFFLEYKDSVDNVTNSKVIAEIQYKYDHEKIEKEMVQLKLSQKEKDIFNYKLFSTIVCVLIAIVFSILWKYKKRKDELRKKATLQKQNEEHLRLSQIKIQDTEEELRGKEILFRLKEKELYDNQLILEQNEHLLGQKEKELKNINDELLEKKSEIFFLRKHEWQLREDFFEKTNIYKKIMNLKNDIIKGFITEADLNELLYETDKQFQNFTVRLKEKYPLLSKADICYCCLFRLRLTAPEIGKLYSVTPDAVNKRKLRIKLVKMKEEINDIAFNDFLQQF